MVWLSVVVVGWRSHNDITTIMLIFYFHKSISHHQSAWIRSFFLHINLGKKKLKALRFIVIWVKTNYLSLGIENGEMRLRCWRKVKCVWNEIINQMMISQYALISEEGCTYKRPRQSPFKLKHTWMERGEKRITLNCCCWL